MSSRDYEEFIESLNQIGARFLVVGAHAVAFLAPQAFLLVAKGQLDEGKSLLAGRWPSQGFAIR